ncbi:single-stranded DNA-binding protein [Plectonema radiosum NIES-515]|uniref:Single-stranded DNA-binding protein n=1 Tax=Plectonema radiosum NIES-515 TaxID=2986073 RepID=A0ABT3B6Q0_9CYAN|nr:single-stranded DNA-binding protein [Plectonema radiosum]MCV3217057.1 single-stranded DNA-binding protein [Plectonema radiosum NIES-515]
MNSCILMAEIVENPQLRYTSDNLEISEMLVRFPGMRPDDPPATLKVVGWGNMAKEIQQNYHEGDRILIEGRLGMHTIERREGFKEKRAELTVQRIHALGAGFNTSSSPRMETTQRQSEVPVAGATNYREASTPVSSPVATPQKTVTTYEPHLSTSQAKNDFGTLSEDDFDEPKQSAKNYDRNPYPAPAQEEPKQSAKNYDRNPYSPPAQDESDIDDIPF